MARPKERLPVIYNFFRQHPDKFNEFFKITGDRAYKSFLEFYEDVVFQHFTYPDLRFGQHLFNLGIVPDTQYHTEEVAWLIDKNYIAAENILLWGTYGVNAVEDRKQWEAAKPKINTAITATEKILGYDKLKNYEVYARRYNSWLYREPKAQFKLLKDLETDHIKAILLTQNMSELYRTTFQKLLKQREPNVESFEITSVDIDCNEDTLP